MTKSAIQPGTRELAAIGKALAHPAQVGLIVARPDLPRLLSRLTNLRCEKEPR